MLFSGGGNDRGLGDIGELNAEGQDAHAAPHPPLTLHYAKHVHMTQSSTPIRILQTLAAMRGGQGCSIAVAGDLVGVDACEDVGRVVVGDSGEESEKVLRCKSR